jgi:hypothetical protein
MTLKKQNYHLVNYSFVVDNKNFIDELKTEMPENFLLKNDKLYVNLRTVEDRTYFFRKLKEFNNNENKVIAKDLLYKYFVRRNSDDTELKFSDIINKVKELLNKDDKTKNLVNSFKVYNLGKNYKVIVSSYDLALLLNGTKMFYPYRSKSERIINVASTSESNVLDV